MNRPESEVAAAFEAMLAVADEAALEATEGRLAKLLQDLTLEHLVCDAELGAHPASDVQRAIIRAADGQSTVGITLPKGYDYHFGCDAAELGARRPRYVILRGGVRSGKSLIAALAMILSALVCKLRRPPDPKHDEIAGPDGLVGVRPGEFVRVLFVAPRKALTHAAFTHASSLLERSELLRPLLVGEVRQESFTMRRPDGQLIEFMIVAASGAGATLRSTWLAGCFFDEADFHLNGEAVVNLDDNFKSVKARLLPNAQAWLVSSPWCEETSFDIIFKAAFGHPGRELAIHSDSRSMNPTLDREEEATERERDPDNAAREWDAIPLTTVSNEFFPKEVLDAAVNVERVGNDLNLPPNGSVHFGGADLGFRVNSSTVAFARGERGKAVLAYYLELRPQPKARLKPSEVCERFSDECHAYDAQALLGDLHYADTAHEQFPQHRARSALSPTPWAVGYVEYDSKQLPEACAAILLRMKAGGIELPNDPRLRAQFKGVKRLVKPGGVVGVKLPSSHGAHADIFVAAILALVQVPELVEDEPDDEGSHGDLEDLIDPPRWGDRRGYG